MLKPVSTSVTEVVRTLNDLQPFERLGRGGRTERWAARWSRRLLLAAFACLAVLAGCSLLREWLPLPAHVLLAALSVLSVLSLSALLLVLTQTVIAIVADQRTAAQLIARECAHDVDNARELAAFTDDALDSALAWVEIKIKSLERRYVRLFGGADKFALVAVIGGAWLIWSHGLIAMTWEPSPALVGVALLAGLFMGGYLSTLKLNKLAYERDLLLLAHSPSLQEDRARAATNLSNLESGHRSAPTLTQVVRHYSNA